MVAKEKEVISALIESLWNGQERFVLTDEGDINQYLSVNIKQNNDSTFELHQPFLIEKILQQIGYLKGQIQNLHQQENLFCT